MYAWDISHALVTTYHPYCHSPSALTEYLRQKLRAQLAKQLGRSLPAQVELNVPLECNSRTMQKMLRTWLNKYPDETGNYIDDMVVAIKGDLP